MVASSSSVDRGFNDQGVATNIFLRPVPDKPPDLCQDDVTKERSRKELKEPFESSILTSGRLEARKVQPKKTSPSCSYDVQAQVRSKDDNENQAQSSTVKDEEWSWEFEQAQLGPRSAQDDGSSRLDDEQAQLCQGSAQVENDEKDQDHFQDQDNVPDPVEDGQANPTKNCQVS